MPDLQRQPTTLFLLEDDAALAREIVLAFDAQGRAVVHLAEPSGLSVAIDAGQVGLLIMDRMIGDDDCLDMLERIRATGRCVPVVVISSKASVDDRIVGLRKGGDDYLVKPFAMGELIARVEALERRATSARETRLQVGSLVLDRIDRTVRRGERDLVLPPREFQLLEYLMLHAGQVVTRAMLLEDVWNYRAPVQTNVIDVHVGNLRRKVDGDGEPRLITTVPGIGFKLSGDAPLPHE